MHRRHFVGSLAGLCLLGAHQAHAADDAYPSKLIRIIVPSPAGSGTDNGVRQVARYFSEDKGWSVVIDNKGGGNGIIAVREVLRSPPDGYTIFGASSSTMSANPVFYKNLPYDPLVDFDPIARGVVVPLALLAAPRLNIHSVAELTAYLRSKNKNFSYATSGANRPVAERYLQAAELTGINVPYKGNPPAVTDLIGGQVDFMFVDTSIALPIVTSGRLKALAFTSPARLKAMPAVPTMDESGFKGFEMSAWGGYFAPKGTPDAVIRTLHDAIVGFFNTKAGALSVDQAGGYFADLTPSAFRSWIEGEITTNKKVYRLAGIEPENL